MVGSAEGVNPSVFSDNIKSAYSRQIGKRPAKIRSEKTIYFSEIGEKCLRKMWFKHHTPDAGESITPVTRIKFLYGDMLEELVLQLARDAGHTVTDEQKEVEYVDGDWRIRGRIDAIIDGAVVDVKSVTKQSERKFHDHLQEDPFGYFGQLNGYASALKNEEMGFLTIQKELGHVHYFPFSPDEDAFMYGIERAVKTLSNNTPPKETLDVVPQSATSKNMKLCTACSYCPFKKECFPTLRAFQYAGKIEFLTHVEVEPKVMEIGLEENFSNS